MLIFVKIVAFPTNLCYNRDINTREVPFMADYEKMYAILCGAASGAVDFLEQDQGAHAIRLLKKALEQAENLYIED